jgi:predicted dienelactone hydrolase
MPIGARLIRTSLAAVLLLGLGSKATSGCMPLASAGAIQLDRDYLYAGRTPQMITTTLADWTDPSRSRTLPVKIYQTAAANGSETASERLPLVVMSHGYGGSRDAFAYLAPNLAEQGYVVVVVQHPGSDTAALRSGDGRLRERLEEGVGDVQNRLNRPADLKFVLDYILADAELGQRVDPGRIAVLGHSFGAYTAACLIGLRVTLPDGTRPDLSDPRVKSAVVLSPQGEGHPVGTTADSWDAIRRPVLYMSGSEDYELGGKPAATRRTPFDRGRGPDQYLLWIDEANHMTFGGRSGLLDNRPPPESQLAVIRAATQAFLDAHLRGDAVACRWLAEARVEQTRPGVALSRKNLTPCRD